MSQFKMIQIKGLQGGFCSRMIMEKVINNAGRPDIIKNTVPVYLDSTDTCLVVRKRRILFI